MMRATMRTSRRSLAPAGGLIGILLAAGCGLSDDAALRVVEAYDRQLADAYRSGDVRVIAEVAGPEEQRKLAGFIGVKGDSGVNLDAHLLSLERTRVAREGGAVLVTTRERWSYVDRRIGTGEPVGPGSTDAYEVTYRLEKLDGRWVVRSISFASPPVVGNPAPVPVLDVPVAHGTVATVPAADDAAPAAKRDGARP